MTCRNSACASTRLASVICPRHFATHSLQYTSEGSERALGMIGYFSCGGQEAEDIPGDDGREKGRSRAHVPTERELGI